MNGPEGSMDERRRVNRRRPDGPTRKPFVVDGVEGEPLVLYPPFSSNRANTRLMSRLVSSSLRPRRRQTDEG